jgi:hypothetical protein
LNTVTAHQPVRPGRLRLAPTNDPRRTRQADQVRRPG